MELNTAQWYSMCKQLIIWNAFYYLYGNHKMSQLFYTLKLWYWEVGWFGFDFKQVEAVCCTLLLTSFSLYHAFLQIHIVHRQKKLLFCFPICYYFFQKSNPPIRRINLLAFQSSKPGINVRWHAYNCDSCFLILDDGYIYVYIGRYIFVKIVIACNLSISV